MIDYFCGGVMEEVSRRSRPVDWYTWFLTFSFWGQLVLACIIYSVRSPGLAPGLSGFFVKLNKIMKPYSHIQVTKKHITWKTYFSTCSCWVPVILAGIEQIKVFIWRIFRTLACLGLVLWWNLSLILILNIDYSCITDIHLLGNLKTTFLLYTWCSSDM